MSSSANNGVKAPTRYIITFAYIPDEATWCVCNSFAAACEKARVLWEVEDCTLVYYLTTHAGRATAVKMTCEEDFAVWYRGGTPLTSKLIAHDRNKAIRVTHSSGLAQISHRPLLDTVMLHDIGGAFYMRHSGADEVVIVSHSEMAVWGRAVQKCQRTWHVHRPLFRYMDDVNGERVIIAIINAEDFRMWYTNRRPLLPELTVFEHAAPQLLDGAVTYAASPPEGTGIPKAIAAVKTDAGVQGDVGVVAPPAAGPSYTPSAYVQPPELKNPFRVETLYMAATGRPAPITGKGQATPGELQLRQLQHLLERRAEIEALAGPPSKKKLAQQSPRAAAQPQQGQPPCEEDAPRRPAPPAEL